MTPAFGFGATYSSSESEAMIRRQAVKGGKVRESQTV